MDSQSHAADDHRASGGKIDRWMFWGFALVAAYFLFMEHRAHMFRILPYLLVLACPLMHLFHHGRHGHHKGGNPSRDLAGPDAGSGPGASSEAPDRLDQ